MQPTEQTPPQTNPADGVAPAPVSPEAASPTPAPAAPQKPKGSKKKLIISLLILLLIAGGAVAAYFMTQDKSDTSNSQTNNQPATTTEQTPLENDEKTDEDAEQVKSYEKRFTIVLPQGWSFNGKEGDLSKPEDEVYEFKNGSDYVKVNLVVGGKDAGSDAGWSYRLKNRSVSLDETITKVCDPNNHVDAFCTGGDGELSIFINPAQEIKFKGINNTVYVSFYAGNTESEDVTKAKISDYKKILNSIEFKN